MLVNFHNKDRKEFYYLHTYPGYSKKHVKTYSIPNGNPSSIAHVGNFVDYVDIKNENIYYVEFLGTETFTHFKLEDYVDVPWLDKVRYDNIKLLLHMSGHGYHEIVENIYLNVVVRDKVPIDNIIISTESFDIEKAVDYVSKKYNVKPFRVRVTLEFELAAKIQAHTLINYLDGAYKEKVVIEPFKFENKKYEKKFLCLNGFYREHRAAIVFLLASKNLLDQGYISYNIKDSGWVSTGSNVYNDLINKLDTNEEAVTLLAKNKEKLCAINNILLDTEYNDRSKSLAQILPEHNYWFNNSYFSVVTETNFPYMQSKNFNYDENEFYDLVGRLYSEKIFRSIIYKHPFLVTGPKHFLKQLRSFGYKTFHPFIDETYDEVDNHATRLMMIVNETERLCNLNEEELIKFLEFTKKICDYNFEVLKRRDKFVFDLPL